LVYQIFIFWASFYICRMPHFPHHSEENYLKELYKLSQRDLKKVNNIALAKAMDLNPATVLEMVRKLTEKQLVALLPDKSIQLTEKGKARAVHTVRKHRLWEVFLVSKLHYKWSEVHELAEQLEHVESDDLINRLEEFLQFPAFDPHGDPIPDRLGKIKRHTSLPLSTAVPGKTYKAVSFADTADSFLDYLSSVNIAPGTKIKVVEHFEYDNSLTISINKKTVQVSEKVAQNILVQPTA
jgi:DtxR family transcriptional regulator, Mn-dependent transcriptional regulator